MKFLAWSRAAIFGGTIGLWLVGCAGVFLNLVESARDSPEIYARTVEFQVISFTIGYLPVFVALLAGVLLFEWLLFAGLKWGGKRLGFINGTA